MGAAVGLGGFEGGGEFLGDLGVFGGEFGGFAGVLVEVVEFVGLLAGFVVADDEFPLAGADGDGAVFAVAEDEDGFAIFSGIGLSEEGGEEAEGVFGDVFGEVFVEDVGSGGEEVGKVDEICGGGAGGNFAGPFGDEGDAVAAFVGVAFAIAVGTVGDVAHFLGVGFGAFELGADVAGVVGEVEVDVVGAAEVLGGGAVVRGEDDEGVFAELVFFEGGEEAADVGVELLDVVAVKSGLAGATELGGGGDVGVWGAGSEVEEEGFFGGGFTLDEGDGFLGEGGVDLIFDAGGGEASGEVFAFDDLVGFAGLAADEVVVLDEGAVFVVVIGGDAEVVGEADFEGAGDGGGVPVLAVAEVPFADGGGVVAVSLEEGGDGHALGVDAVAVSFFVESPRGMSGEEAVAGRGAEGGGGVDVAELDALGGDAVDVGRADLGGAVAAEVAKAQVIGVDHDDVWFIRGEGGVDEAEEGKE